MLNFGLLPFSYGIHVYVSVFSGEWVSFIQYALHNKFVSTSCVALSRIMLLHQTQGTLKDPSAVTRCQSLQKFNYTLQ